MNKEKIRKILRDTAYVRTAGSKEEKQVAEYLKNCCEEIGCAATIETYPLQLAEIHNASLFADGKEIPCKAFKCCGEWDLTAPLCYLPNADEVSLKKVKGKIVLVDGGMGHFLYCDIVKNGAVGFISVFGNVNFSDHDIDQLVMGENSDCPQKIPGVRINAKDAVKLVAEETKEIRIVISQTDYTADSYNVIADIPGTGDEYIALSAHLDSTSVSKGAYDNMSGCIGLLGIMQKLKAGAPYHYGLRFLFCGGEELGLYGSKAYVEARKDELEKCVLNVNLDMIGSIMGRFVAVCTSEEKLCHYIEYLASELGWSAAVSQDVYSSDSTPFADNGVPAVSFARHAGGFGPVHVRYDTADVLSEKRLQEDTDFISAFVKRMAGSVLIPVAREIPDNMKEKIDEFWSRKRPKK